MLKFKTVEEYSEIIGKILYEFDAPMFVPKMKKGFLKAHEEEKEIIREGIPITITYKNEYDLGVIPDSYFRLETKNASIFVWFCNDRGYLSFFQKKNGKDTKYISEKLEKIVHQPILNFSRIKKNGVTLQFDQDISLEIKKEQNIWNILEPFKYSIEASNKKQFKHKLYKELVKAYHAYDEKQDREYDELQNFLEENLDENEHCIHYIWKPIRDWED